MTTAAWWALALLHAVPGLAALLAPATFAGEVAGLPTDAPHYVRDVGVGEVVLVALAVWAARVPQVRRPVAAVLALQLVLHATSHAVDGHGGAVVPALVAQAVLLSLGARSSAPGRARGASVPARP